MSKGKSPSGLRTVTTFVGGIAAGVAIGMLLAPDKGSETRRKLNNRARDLEDDIEAQLGDAISEFSTKSRVTLDDIRKQATELFDRANLSVQELLHKYAVADDDILDFEPEDEHFPPYDKNEGAHTETAGANSNAEKNDTSSSGKSSDSGANNTDSGQDNTKGSAS
mgnify:CR=1 FL=1